MIISRATTLALSFIINLTVAIVPSPIKGNLKGFNYASTDASTVSWKDQFNNAKSLVGTTGISSARFYTMINPGSTNQPLDIFGPASETGTSLLLGLYCSAGEEAFNTTELVALKAALDANKENFPTLVVGISVGNEDLYRQEAHESDPNTKLDAGDTPGNIIKYIGYTKDLLKQYSLDTVIPVGHCDTWSAWETNSDGGAVIPVVDFVGLNSFPYWEGSDNADMVWHMTNAVAKVGDEVTKHGTPGALPPLWVTETGYPYAGNTLKDAIPSKSTAQEYWQGVGCDNYFDSGHDPRNIWWFKLQSTPATTGVDAGLNWGVIQNLGDTTPVYDLSCDGSGSSTTTSAPQSTSTANGVKRRANDQGLRHERRFQWAEKKR